MSDPNQTIESCQSAVITPRGLSRNQSDACFFHMKPAAWQLLKQRDAEQKWCNWFLGWRLMANQSKRRHQRHSQTERSCCEDEHLCVSTVAVRSRTAQKKQALRVTPVSKRTHSKWWWRMGGAQTHALTQDGVGWVGLWRCHALKKTIFLIWCLENIFFLYCIFWASETFSLSVLLK